MHQSSASETQKATPSHATQTASPSLQIYATMRRRRLANIATICGAIRVGVTSVAMLLAAVLLLEGLVGSPHKKRGHSGFSEK
jgi:hypothetical protein